MANNNHADQEPVRSLREGSDDQDDDWDDYFGIRQLVTHLTDRLHAMEKRRVADKCKLHSLTCRGQAATCGKHEIEEKMKQLLSKIEELEGELRDAHQKLAHSDEFTNDLLGRIIGEARAKTEVEEKNKELLRKIEELEGRHVQSESGSHQDSADPPKMRHAQSMGSQPPRCSAPLNQTSERELEKYCADLQRAIQKLQEKYRADLQRAIQKLQKKYCADLQLKIQELPDAHHRLSFYEQDRNNLLRHIEGEAHAKCEIEEKNKELLRKIEELEGLYAQHAQPESGSHQDSAATPPLLQSTADPPKIRMELEKYRAVLQRQKHHLSLYEQDRNNLLRHIKGEARAKCEIEEKNKELLRKIEELEGRLAQHPPPES